MDFKNIIGFLFLASITLFGVKLDRAMLKQSKYVDYVELESGGSYFEYQSGNDQSDAIITPDNIDRLTIRPTINFYNDLKHNRVMGIIELASKNRYLNASYFDTIDIKGKLNNCTLAISDESLFKKEDNFIIGQCDKKINLGSLLDKVDMRKLKYLVFFAPTKEDINIQEIVFSHTKKEPKKITKSVWIWSSKDIDIKKIKDNNIKTVYLQVDENFEKSANFLDENDIEVYALDGDPSFIFDNSRLMSDIDRIKKINKAKKIIKGLEVDIEPHILKDFGLHSESYLQKLIILSKLLFLKCKENQLAFSIVIPFWYDSIYLGNKNIAYTLINIADEVVLMSYHTNPIEVLKISANKLLYAEHKNKKVKLGIELMPIEDEHHFIYDVKEISKCSNIENFPHNCKGIKPINYFTLKGSDISFYHQKDKLKQFLDFDINYTSFGGFVFHNINGL